MRALPLLVISSCLALSSCRPEPSGPVCKNTCEHAFDGECDDGGPGSLYSVCEYGTDCGDCGTRGGTVPPTATTIGPDGGTLRAAGVTLEIPAGALSRETELVVRESGGVSLPAGVEARSRVFSFEPDGITFAIPIEVAFEGVTDPSTEVFWSNASGGFDRLPTVIEGGAARAQVTHFSHGFAGGPSGACACSERGECCDGCAPIAEREQCDLGIPDQLGFCRAGACEPAGMRRTVATFGSFINSVAVSIDGSVIAAGDGHGDVRVFDAGTLAELASFSTLFEAGDVSLSHDGRTLAASGCNRAATTCIEGLVEVYDIPSNTRILSQVLPGFGRSVALHYDASTESPAGVSVATCTPGATSCAGLLQVYALDGSLIHELHSPLGGLLSSLAVSRSGGWLAMAGCDQPDERWGCTRGRARVLRTDTWATVYDDAPFTTYMYGIAILPGTSYVLMGSRGLLEPGFYLRAAPSGRELAALDVCADEIVTDGSIAWATHCTTGGIEDGNVRVYDFTDVDTPRFVVQGSSYEITTIALGPSGSFLVTGGSDGIVRRWDLIAR